MLKRHGKSKFSEGEVVLCYEPDPAKTKVLYSSKVRLTRHSVNYFMLEVHFDVLITEVYWYP